MQLPILAIQNASLKEFIQFWAQQYRYANSKLYTENIGRPLTPERVFQLFEWKNGSPLSGKKRASIQKNYLNEEKKAPLEDTEDKLRAYLKKPGGAIWRIFWLHCHAPTQYPIYDQHVHRAMAKLEGWEEIEIPVNNTNKVDVYLQHYLPFWKKFSGFDYQTLDCALWSYGKFLSLAYQL